MSRPAPLVHSTVLAARIFYGLRRSGFSAGTAHLLSEQSAQGRPVDRVLAHASRHPA